MFCASHVQTESHHPVMVYFTTCNVMTLFLPLVYIPRTPRHTNISRKPKQEHCAKQGHFDQRISQY